MKATKDFRGRGGDFGAEDSLKRAAKLDPIKKSGKERHVLYSQIDEEEDMELIRVRKKDSILDYFDDGEEEDQEFDEDDELDDEEWEEDDEFDEELDDDQDEEVDASFDKVRVTGRR